VGRDGARENRVRMNKPVDNYWRLRLKEVRTALEGNNFEAHVVADVDEARRLVLDDILPKTEARSVSWGGSITLMASGLVDALKGRSDLEVLDTFDRSLPVEEMRELRRRALLVDLFLTGTNAVTEGGQLVNLDGAGNRVAAITFGPRHVVILVGRNKVVPGMEEGMLRIKNYAAPVNAMRLDRKTPCVKTGSCEECQSPERICNSWAITEKSFPKGRIKVILINDDIGF